MRLSKWNNCIHKAYTQHIQKIMAYIHYGMLLSIKLVHCTITAKNLHKKDTIYILYIIATLHII